MANYQLDKTGAFVQGIISQFAASKGTNAIPIYVNGGSTSTPGTMTQITVANMFSAFSVTNGTTTGPKLTITIAGQSRNVTLPAASATISGVITTGSQTIAGNKTFKEEILIEPTDSSSSFGYGITTRTYWNNTVSDVLELYYMPSTKRAQLTLGGRNDSSGNATWGIISMGSSGTGNNICIESVANRANGGKVYYLPDYNGNGYLTHTSGTSAVGTSSIPVYCAANGRITQVTASSMFSALSWTAGAAAGPTLSITIAGQNRTAVIPSASDSASGIITTGAQNIAGVKTFIGSSSTSTAAGLILQYGNIWIQGGSAAGGNSGRMLLTSGMPTGLEYNTSQRGVRIYSNAIAFADPYNGNSNNDSGWIRHREETGNSGELEIAVGDDGAEVIAFRNYNTSSAIAREGYLFYTNGYSYFPSFVISDYGFALADATTPHINTFVPQNVASMRCWTDTEGFNMALAPMYLTGAIGSVSLDAQGQNYSQFQIDMCWYNRNSPGTIGNISPGGEEIRIYHSNTGGASANCFWHFIDGGVFWTGGEIIGGLNAATWGMNGAGGQFRAPYGSYGHMSRNDGGNYYHLCTSAGYPYGTWTSFRPYRYNFSNGVAYLTTSCDIRMKKDIEITEDFEAYTVLNNLHIFNYKYNTYEENDPEGDVVFNGFSAQELKHILQENNIGYRPYLQIGLKPIMKLKEKESDEEFYTRIEDLPEREREKVISEREKDPDYETDQESPMQSYDLNIDDDDTEATFAIDFTKMVPLLIKGWQMHQRQIEQLQQENAELRVLLNK